MRVRGCICSLCRRRPRPGMKINLGMAKACNNLATWWRVTRPEFSRHPALVDERRVRRHFPWRRMPLHDAERRQAQCVARGGPSLPPLRGAPAARSTAGAARRRAGARTGRRPGAGHTGACDRHPVERPERRSPASLAGRGSRCVLRPATLRDHPDGPVLSRARALGRSAAAARVCAPLAPETACVAAGDKAHAAGRPVRTGLSTSGAAQGHAYRDGACVARIRPRISCRCRTRRRATPAGSRSIRGSSAR